MTMSFIALPGIDSGHMSLGKRSRTQTGLS